MLARGIAWGVVAASLFWLLGPPSIAGRLVLAPESVLHGQVWRLLTFAFLENTPAGLILYPLAIRWIGGELERLWGARRFAGVGLGFTVAGGALTILAALGDPEGKYGVRAGGFVGARALALVLALAYGLVCGRAPLGLPRLPELAGAWTSGYTLAAAAAGYLALNALFFGPLEVIPDTFALIVTAAYILLARRRPRLRLLLRALDPAALVGRRGV